jgi:hypothetical protein
MATAPNEAERMWLRMQRETGVKSLGKHSKAWIELVQRFLSRAALDKLTQQITQATTNLVTRKILEATAEGNGIEWLRQQIERTGLIRARTIARTEVVRSRNAGYFAAADALPYEALKVWNSAKDNRTRGNPAGPKSQADHWDLNGVQKELNEYFVDPKNGAMLMYPGDSDGPGSTGANTVNCRCRLTFIAKRGPDGLPIMKG